MAKRFTATEKWDDPWFHQLTNDMKLAWLFLLDKCDHSGMWNVNEPLMQFHLGFTPSPSDFMGRVVEHSPEKWFVPKFVSFQYGELSLENRVHISVLSKLRKEGLCKDLISPLLGAKDKDKEKESLKEEKRGEVWRGERRDTKSFLSFWSAYPKRRSKGEAFKAWRALDPSEEQVRVILDAINRATKTADWLKDSGQFIPFPATWLRARGWEDDLATTKPTKELVG